MKRTAFILLLTALVAGSCVKKHVPADDSLLGLEYYPTDKGKYIVYDVDSTIYTLLPADTLSFKYRIKEKIADSFTDSQGREAIRLERYIKKYNPSKSYDSISWTIKEVWTLNADKRSVQVVESNVRFTKLIFPIQEKASWDGNAYNTQGERQYTYDHIEKAETINKTKFDKVLLVTQRHYATLISLQNYAEKYAKGTGLVYREITDIQSNNIVKDVPVENRITSGIIFKQSFVTTGYE